MTSREFAIQVVQQLQAAGFEALWAGGCVRDQLLQKTPKDYDVATNAQPNEVREVFGKKRTLAIGASFGVITVLGPTSVDPIEVATFRRDAEYSDGRRPDSVQYTDAREDALRRDFTINGMFFDPLAERVIDFVGGQDDLKSKRIRAIGDPHQRINEDKLRMLRGVRFASTFAFDLDAATMDAIQQHAHEINVVSGERIGAEMRRMLAHPNRSLAVQMLRDSGLLQRIVPSGESLFVEPTAWQLMLVALERLAEPNFCAAVTIFLQPLIQTQGIDAIVNAWKLSNAERKTITWIGKHLDHLSQAHDHSWSRVQPLLIAPDCEQALNVLESKWGPDQPGLIFCRKRLRWEPEKLDPQPLIDGQDLIAAGIRPGPAFKQILELIRAAQLDGEIETAQQAIEKAGQIALSHQKSG